MLMASPRPPMPPVTTAIRLVMLILLVNSLRLMKLEMAPARPCRLDAFFVWLFRRATLAPRRVLLALRTFDGQRDAHAAADAQRRQTLLRVALLHFVQQRDENPAARCADRVTDRNRPAVHVDLRLIPAHLLVHRER